VHTLGLSRRFAILDESAREALWRHLIAAHDLDVKYPAQLTSRMDALRLGRTRYGAMKQDDDLGRLRELAQVEKLRRGVVDFDDLLDHATALLPVALGSPETAFLTPQHVLVDEFQDCEPRELEFLRQLRTGDAAFFAVGDPYQSIYAWRGGSPQLFDAVQREFGCEAQSLPVNYRSTPAILACARAVLGAQQGVVTNQGNLQGTRSAGDKVVVRRHHDAFHEAVYVRDRVLDWQTRGVPLREVAVLARTRRQLQAFSAVLKDAGIACEESARASLAQRPAAAWLLQLLRALLWPGELDAARDALLHPQFGCLTGRQWTRKALEKHAAQSKLQGLPALAAMLADKPGKDPEQRRDLAFAQDVVQRLVDGTEILAEPVPGCGGRLWQHLALQHLLRPTAARHEQDAQDVRKLLAGLEGFAQAHAETTGDGLRHALDEIALHGVGVLGETADPQSESVKLLTLHASKGLEFRHVFLSGVNQGVVPLARTWGDAVADAEERRLLFVGLTRARDSVELGWHGRPPHPQALAMASPYLLSMPAVWTEWLDGSQPPLVQAPAVTPEPVASPLQPGMKVRHPRYGLGEVLTVADGTIAALFTKFGERSFPVLLCPLAVV
jgi:DNA helicase-2/ATP-dependent DNA helicase PcrA